MFFKEEYEQAKSEIKIKVRKEKIDFENPCEICKLYKTVNSPKMEITGEGRTGILFIAEAPGKTEDQTGIQLVGEAGDILRENLYNIGFNLDKDFYKANAVNCRPTKVSDKGSVSNRTPTPKEIIYCLSHIWPKVKELKPKGIILLGSVAVQSFLKIVGWQKGDKPSLAKWRGWLIPSRDFNCYVVPTYHPSALLRNPKDRVLKKVFTKDLEYGIFSILNTPFKIIPSSKELEKNVTCLWEEKEILNFLDYCLKEKPLFVPDFETTGLKPHKKGHDIICAGVSIEDYKAVAFFMDSQKVREKFAEVLKNKKIPKSGYNNQMEERWTRAKLGVKTKNWIWDPMVVSHIQDDRSDITSLAFQVAIRYGEFNFKSEVDPFLKSKIKGGNEFNRIYDAPKDRLLNRAGLDALYERLIFRDQRKELRYFNGKSKHKLVKGINFFLKGIQTFSNIENTGFRIDEDYFREQIEIVSDKITDFENKIYDSKLGKLYEEKVGKKINPSSDDQLRKLLYTFEKIEPPALTDKGSYKVDHATLELILKDKKYSKIHPFIQFNLDYRKWTDAKSKYLEGFLREAVNGFIYPSFNLHLNRGFRSSSSNPNWQNIPVRDKEIKMMIRGGLYPFIGHHLLEIDYSGIEVRIAACITKDKELIRYINDKTSDMHRDSAIDCFMLDKELVTKELRYNAKNQFVFPQFYGSYWALCAKDLWENSKDKKLSDGTPFIAHLKNKGIKKFGEFEEHIKDVEKRFWNKFSGYKKWKEQTVEKYLETLEVELPTGFIVSGVLQRNQILNRPIQGPAFHCLLWSLNTLDDLREEEHWDTKIIGQIHDSGVFSVQPEEKSYIFKTCKRVMTEDIKIDFNWIIVPLEVEAELTDIDKPWSTKKEIKI